MTHRNPTLPASPPIMLEAIRMVAALGGFLKRTGDGFPGTQVMWRGLLKLETATTMYDIMEQSGILPRPDGIYSGECSVWCEMKKGRGWEDLVFSVQSSLSGISLVIRRDSSGWEIRVPAGWSLPVFTQDAISLQVVPDPRSSAFPDRDQDGSGELSSGKVAGKVLLDHVGNLHLW